MGQFGSKVLWFIALALAAQTSVRCAELPKYDIDLHCKATTAVFASSQDFMMESCIEAEKKSRSQIALRLDPFSAETLKSCDALASATAGGSYQAFAGCLAMQIADRFLKGEIDIVPVKK
jgi:hypothetical protein